MVINGHYFQDILNPKASPDQLHDRFKIFGCNAPVFCPNMTYQKDLSVYKFSTDKYVLNQQLTK